MSISDLGCLRGNHILIRHCLHVLPLMMMIIMMLMIVAAECKPAFVKCA